VTSGTAVEPSADQAWEKILSRVRTFPSLPVIVDKVAELVEHPDTTAKDIESVVATDQTLTARLLRLVNSPFYGFPQKVTTISRAIGLLGFEALRNLAFSTSVIQMFKKDASGGWDPDQFWKHSIGTAIAAKELARCLGEKQVEEFFVGGLIHDVGKLVHNEFLKDEFTQAVQRAHDRDMLLRDTEQEILQFSHERTAGILLAHWRLPTRLINMTTDHHSPGRNRECARDAAVIHLADILCRAKGFGSGGDNRIPKLKRSAWDVLGLTVGDLEQVMGRMDQEFETATAMLVG
jgi:putative nucleotidyltransferase with HDIG domain